MPHFELPATTGEVVRTAELIGRGPIVLYFYPRDETLGCTIESCAFRDQHAAFVEAGAIVLGVSPDSVDSHRQFQSHHGLPFTLLSDPDRRVFRLYGVRDLLGFLPLLPSTPGRETFVSDREGMIRHHLRANLQPRKHVLEALAAVRRLVAG